MYSNGLRNKGIEVEQVHVRDKHNTCMSEKVGNKYVTQNISVFIDIRHLMTVYIICIGHKITTLHDEPMG
jgi:hypothetical protein